MIYEENCHRFLLVFMNLVKTCSSISGKNQSSFLLFPCRKANNDLGFITLSPRLRSRSLCKNSDLHSPLRKLIMFLIIMLLITMLFDRFLLFVYSVHISVYYLYMFNFRKGTILCN